MDTKDITRKHTRKEMNSIAEDLGLENPQNYRNKAELAEAIIPLMEQEEETEDETPEEEVKEEEVKEEEVKEEEVKEEEEAEDEADHDQIREEFQRIRDIWEKAKKTMVDVKEFKNEAKELAALIKDEEWERAEKKKNELVQTGEDILNLKDRFKKIDSLIYKISSKERRKEYLEQLDDLIELTKNGDYGEALKKGNEFKGEIENKVAELEKARDELEEKIKKAKNILSDLRGTKINIGDIKEGLSVAVKAQKDGRFEEGLEKIENSLKDSEKIFEIFDKIQLGKEMISKINRKGLGIQAYLDILKNSKKKADEGDFQYSLQLLDDAIADMKTDLDEIVMEEEDIEDIDKKIKGVYKKIEAIEKALRFVKRDLDRLMNKKHK